MNFLYYKSKNKKNDSFLNAKVFESEEVLKISPFEFVKFEKKIFKASNNSLFFNGRILFDGYNENESIELFVNKIQNSDWPISEDISGYFSGLFFNEKNTYIFNDPIGIYNLFYYLSNDEIIVSTSLTYIYKIKHLDLDFTSLVLETIPPFVQYNTSTVLMGVKRLLPGELLILKDFEIINSLYDTTIKVDDCEPNSNYTNELVDLINSESDKLYNSSILISLSGGIDSRINLAPLIINKKNIKAINYGKKDCIDSDIPNNISRKFNFNLEIIDPTPDLFPEIEKLDKLIEKTDSLYINMWHSILQNDNKQSDVFLLGDILDILRAKRIRKLKSRKFKTSFYVKNFIFGTKLRLTPISQELKNNFIEDKIKRIIEKALDNFKFFNFSEYQKNIIVEEIEKCIRDFSVHLEKYNCKYIESYEELFEMFTEGRLSMGRQLNLLQYKFNVEIPLTNIKILRKVLNIAPNYRYADELTTQMFKTNTWKSLGSFPTAQNPFTAYNSPKFVMLLGWFLRSKIDNLLTKLYVLTNGKSKKNRLFKTFDHQQGYSYMKAYEKYKSYFPKNDFCDFSEKVNLFEKRMNKQSWPLASMDLMPYAQVMYYVRKFSNIK